MDSSSLRKNVPLLVVLLFILFMYVSSNIAKHNMKDPKFSRDLSTTYPKTAYQALFTQKSDKGEGHVILSSDGQGHLRLKEQASVLKYTHDTVDPKQEPKSLKVDVARITLLDYLNGKKYVVFDHDKAYQESELSNLGVGIFDEEMYRSSKATSLGTTEMEGQQVRGWKTTLPLTDEEQIEAWFNTKTGCLVYARGNGVETRLLKYMNVGLPPQAFEPPPDYKKSKI